MEKLRGWMQNVSGLMVGLSRRDRIFVKSALVFVIVFLLVRFVIIPFSGQQARLNQSLDGEKEKLAEMLRCMGSLDYARGRVEEFVTKALDSLADLKAGPAKNALIETAKLIGCSQVQ